MKVLIIRHAQSENNIVQAESHVLLKNGELSPEQAQARWLLGRKEDPSLSEAGFKQTKTLAKQIRKSNIIDKKARVRLFTSPMRRACETAAAVAESFRCSPTVHPDLFEVGGMYRAVPVQSASKTGPALFKREVASGMTRDQIQSSFPGVNVDMLPSSGPWDGGKGFETTSDALKRAARVCEWLTSPELHNEIGEDGILTIVSHADFIALLLANLHNETVEAAGHGTTPDNDVSYHSISEKQLEQNMPRRTSAETPRRTSAETPRGDAADALRRQASTNEAKFVANVFSKYKISLASTCYLEIHRDSSLTVHSINDKVFPGSKGKCSIQ